MVISKLLAIQKASMATTNKLLLFLLFFVITLLFSAQLLQDFSTKLSRRARMETEEGWVSGSSDQTQKQHQQQPSLEMKKIRGRKMIGSTLPTCTYNECRGCKHKCRAEQVPVEGSDPLNSPYRYRCICHR